MRTKPFGNTWRKNRLRNSVGMESHFFLNAAVRIVLPTKADLFSVEGEQAVIGDGNTMWVAAQITEHLYGTAEGGFSVNHPTPQVKTPQQLGEVLAPARRDAGPERQSFPC
jgi:hypothetical protein